MGIPSSRPAASLRAATIPPGTGTPAELSTLFAMSFFIASAEASTPEWL